jgi:pimeloyl-ACP methyl ester carboxylesterase
MSVETHPVGNASADSAEIAVEHSLEAPPSETCPSPLGWTEVLESVRAESEHWSLDVEGAVLRGQTLGRGRPLYFLNGISGNRELFCLLAWLLKDDFCCVLFDYRSRASSTRAKGQRTQPLTRSVLAADLIAVADAQGHPTLSLFAAQFGSLVALATLMEFPIRVEQAILLGGFARRPLSPFERLLCGLGRWMPGDISKVPLRSTLQCASHQRSFPPFDATRWDFFAQNTSRTAIGDLADRAALFASFDLRGRLSQVHQRVLLIRTENEGSISAAGQEELERELPRASVEEMPLAGQLAYLTHPHRVARAMRSFLGGGSPGERPSCEAGSLDNSSASDHKDKSCEP